MKKNKPQLKQALKAFKESLCLNLEKDADITSATEQLLAFIDKLLIDIYHQNKLDKNRHFCLIALGSYGRKELQLYSDIDILLLYKKGTTHEDLARAQCFIQQCWDAGIEISHQITSIQDCAALAAEDLSVISSLMDMRLICGCASLMEELEYQIHPLHMWPSDEFFYAKKAEQRLRHKKYDETAYNLEPNVKNGPGGLRDLHTLLYIAKRHFKIKKLSEGINYGLISDKEYEELLVCQHFLWRVRFALHYLAGKKEDRLLFDYQSKLAEFFAYKDEKHSLAIEQFMKIYFKIIKRNRELNDLLIQWYSEVIVEHPRQKLTPLDDAFQLSSHYIEVKHPRAFQHQPRALLKLFVLISHNTMIKGVRASTIRLIRKSLYLINNKFKQSQHHAALFLEILHGKHIYEALQRMNRYGVLARYLDAFSSVTGQMQYDLFHVYTVDQHTLFVIRNISRFKNDKYAGDFPLCAEVIKKIAKPEVLYLAALFHDIAKGRGGDHSELGAQEAEIFAKRHLLNKDDTLLLCWLVRHHLLMSSTAQRKDVYDPTTIASFCKQLPETHYLDYLYLLTVADICATNPKLWNAWKDSLLRELYKATEQTLQAERAVIDETIKIKTRQQYAVDILSKQGVPSPKVYELWTTFKPKYFLHESSEIIARHTKDILESKQFPLIVIHPHHSQGGTEIMIYMPHRADRFVITTTVLSNFHITIQEASILTCDNNYDLDTYIVLDDTDNEISEEQRIKQIKNGLFKHLNASHRQLPVISKKRLSRAYTYLKFKPRIEFYEDEPHQLTAIFLVTKDKPGLLASISQVFFNKKIHLHNAKIATQGERVEDMFYISNSAGKPLNEEEKHELKLALSKTL